MPGLFCCVVVSYEYHNDKEVRLLIAYREKQTLALITRRRTMVLCRNTHPGLRTGCGEFRLFGYRKHTSQYEAADELTVTFLRATVEFIQSHKSAIWKGKTLLSLCTSLWQDCRWPWLESSMINRIWAIIPSCSDTPPPLYPSLVGTDNELWVSQSGRRLTVEEQENFFIGVGRRNVRVVQEKEDVHLINPPMIFHLLLICTVQRDCLNDVYLQEKLQRKDSFSLVVHWQPG